MKTKSNPVKIMICSSIKYFPLFNEIRKSLDGKYIVFLPLPDSELQTRMHLEGYNKLINNNFKKIKESDICLFINPEKSLDPETDIYLGYALANNKYCVALEKDEMDTRQCLYTNTLRTSDPQEVLKSIDELVKIYQLR